MIEQLHCNETITIQRNANVVDWIYIWNVWLFKKATENQEKVWLNLHGGCKWSPWETNTGLIMILASLSSCLGR